MRFLVAALLIVPVLDRDVPLYPTGDCDTIVRNLPGLNDIVHQPVQVRNIGTSANGLPIYAEYWGPSKATMLGMPTYLVVAQVHGDECSPQLVVDEIRKQPPTQYAVWLIPTLNPDGYASNTRQNGNGFDLNSDGYRRQPETRLLLKFIKTMQPTLTIHVHSPNGVVGHWGSDEAAVVADRVAKSMGFRVAGAGYRDDKRYWFLWQVLWDRLEQQSILVELHAVSIHEALGATPLPPSKTVEASRQDVRAMLEGLVP